MPKKNIELLKKLRTRFLRMRHKKHFNMKPIAMKTDCGTAMCLAGHTLDLAGYKMRRHEHLPSEVFYGRVDFDFFSRSGRLVPCVLDAAAKELGLPDDQAMELFHDWSLRTPKQAAKRIEALISDNVPAS